MTLKQGILVDFFLRGNSSFARENSTRFKQITVQTSANDGKGILSITSEANSEERGGAVGEKTVSAVKKLGDCSENSSLGGSRMIHGTTAVDPHILHNRLHISTIVTFSQFSQG